MAINYITTDDLLDMKGKEGLILQGCGSDPQEWLEGINDMLTEDGILLDSTKFKNISVFENDGITCILFPFENVHLKLSKLAIWRIRTRAAFAGMWLSDYVNNKLYEKESKQ